MTVKIRELTIRADFSRSVDPGIDRKSDKSEQQQAERKYDLAESRKQVTNSLKNRRER